MDLVKERLRRYIEKHQTEGETKEEQDSVGSGDSLVPKVQVIPSFYHPPPGENDLLRQKLREEARAEFLQRRSKSLLDNEELKQLWALLDAHAQPSTDQELGANGAEIEQMLTYDDYKTVASKAGEKCAPFFTAVVFAKLQQNDPHGRISTMALFNYVMRKVWLHQTRIGLSLYDVTGQG